MRLEQLGGDAQREGAGIFKEDGGGCVLYSAEGSLKCDTPQADSNFANTK